MERCNQQTYDIYIGKLPKFVKEDDIRNIFMKFGTVTDILSRYEKGEYGYGIVKFKYKEDADKLLREVTQVDICGQFLEVKAAKRNNYNNENRGQAFTPCIVPNVTQHPYSRNSCNDLPYPFLKGPPFPHGNFPEPLPSIIEVMCTSVENAITFYGCPIFNAEELRRLSRNMNNICPTFPRFGKKPMRQCVYAALFEEDQCWYRCVVIHNSIPSKPEMCRVFYIDYGNEEDISYNKMVMLPKVLQEIPPLAVRCVLTNLTKATATAPSTTAAVTYLHHLVNHRMSLYATWNAPNSEYKVIRCSSNGIDVISEIVKKGQASYKNLGTFTRESNLPNKSDILKPKTKFQKEISPTTVKCNGVSTSCISNETKPVISKINGKAKVNLCEVKSKQIALNKLTLNKTPSHQIAKAENLMENVPKQIMKRGSEVKTTVPQLLNVSNGSEKTYLIKVDTVIANLKLTNNIRDLISLSTDDSIISDAVNFLMKETEITNLSSNSIEPSVEDASKKYFEILEEIRNCADKALLPELKLQRDSQRDILLRNLKEYLESFDASILEKKDSMQKLITNLESNSNAWMNVYLDSPPQTVEELLSEYKKVKGERKIFIQNAREITDEKHKSFMECLSSLQEEFSLHTSERTHETSNVLSTIPKTNSKESWSYKLEEKLSNLGKALEKEIESCAVSKGKGSTSVIQCILDKLDIPKDKIDIECSKYEKYFQLHKNHSNLADLESIFSNLVVIQEKIKALDMQLSTSSAKTLNAFKDCHFDNTSCDNEKSDLLLFLHQNLEEESDLMDVITAAYLEHFPELNIEQPCLKLKECILSKGLLKSNWSPKWFVYQKDCIRLKTAYHSTFVKHPVVIKEYVVPADCSKREFFHKAVTWNNINSDLLVKIKALFYKDENTLCAIIPSAWSTLLEMPTLSIPAEGDKACQMLRQVLKALRDIHSQGAYHGVVHPLTVLCEEGKVLLDFGFHQHVDDELLRGLNFLPEINSHPSESSDMYSFGCLVLWLLFPNLLFTSTELGVPNIAAFRSIVEQMLSANDYALLCALVNSNIDLRPSACKLLSNNFLSEYESFCKLSCLK